MASFFDLITIHDGFLANNVRPRQRITRACDQCHQLRTRCDGKLPCSRCVELTANCEYLRKPKKRGKASWKRSRSPPSRDNSSNDRPLKPDTKISPPSSNVDESAPPEESFDDEPHSPKKRKMSQMSQPRSVPTPDSMRDQAPPVHEFDMMPDAFHQHGDMYGQHTLHGDPIPPSPAMFGGLNSPGSFPMPPQVSLVDMNHAATQASMSGAYASAAAHSPERSDQSQSDSFLRENGFPSGSYVPQSLWPPSKPTPTALSFPHDHDSLIVADMKLRYPVLAPLMPHLINIISSSLATELLEFYFTTFTGNGLHPLSSYIQTFIFRRSSILHPTNPRRCSPALLCSMLWLAAQTSDAQALTDGPSSRTRISQKLLELTVELLKPLRHQPEGKPPHLTQAQSGDSREQVFVPPAGNPLRAATENTFSLSSSIDQIITYIHLGTVCSASEHKASSIRWWSVAWSMARDMKLNREVSRPDLKEEEPESIMTFPENTKPAPSPTENISEEEREERRRIWWLLYMVDRHLSLCYNQPLTLLDVECETLCQPLDERLWQHSEPAELERILMDVDSRPRGPQTKCCDLSLFGYFLPLMTILGGIIDMIRAKNHPRFGRYSQSSQVWDDFAAEITMQLDDYQYSLEQLGAMNNANDDPDEQLQRRIAMAYGTHIMHVMHILLTGKWDPVGLLDDDDHWVSSQAFVTAAKHATSAAEAIGSIFDDDLDLSFMPWFFGIYLLHGSFILLLVADKLQSQTTPAVLKACETIVRAHEACVVTLDNEYQRNFRKIMISAIAQVKGRRTEDHFVQQQQRRREVLSLYRWTGGGGGLAL